MTKPESIEETLRPVSRYEAAALVDTTRARLATLAGVSAVATPVLAAYTHSLFQDPEKSGYAVAGYALASAATAALAFAKGRKWFNVGNQVYEDPEKLLAEEFGVVIETDKVKERKTKPKQYGFVRRKFLQGTTGLVAGGIAAAVTGYLGREKFLENAKKIAEETEELVYSGKKSVVKTQEIALQGKHKEDIRRIYANLDELVDQARGDPAKEARLRDYFDRVDALTAITEYMHELEAFETSLGINVAHAKDEYWNLFQRFSDVSQTLFETVTLNVTKPLDNSRNEWGADDQRQRVRNHLIKQGNPYGLQDKKDASRDADIWRDHSADDDLTGWRIRKYFQYETVQVEELRDLNDMQVEIKDLIDLLSHYEADVTGHLSSEELPLGSEEIVGRLQAKFQAAHQRLMQLDVGSHHGAYNLEDLQVELDQWKAKIEGLEDTVNQKYIERVNPRTGVMEKVVVSPNYNPKGSIDKVDEAILENVEPLANVVGMLTGTIYGLLTIPFAYFLTGAHLNRKNKKAARIEGLRRRALLGLPDKPIVKDEDAT